MNNKYRILNIEYQMNGLPSLDHKLQHARCLDYNLKTILQYVAILTLIFVLQRRRCEVCRQVDSCATKVAYQFV